MGEQLRHKKSLTDRQREIMLTLAQGGLSNRDVCRQLSLSEGTVKAHLHNIYKKLGVNKRTALVAVARTRREELKRPICDQPLSATDLLCVPMTITGKRHRGGAKPRCGLLVIVSS